jgi:hypothetical protein
MNIRITTSGDMKGIPSCGCFWSVERVVRLGFGAVPGFAPVVESLLRHVEDSGA